MFKKISINIIYILENKDYQFLIIIKNNLNKQIKARLLQKTILEIIIIFIFENIILYYKYFKKPIINKGLKNKNLIKEFIQFIKIQKLIIFI